MAATGRSSRSVLRSLSSSQRLHNHHHHHRRQRSPSPSNLRLKFSPGNIPKPSVTVSNFPKRKCLCSPTTHPNSFRCALHRKSGHDKPVILYQLKKRNNGGNSKRNVGLNLRKLALMNSLAMIGGAEAERFRRSLGASLVIKPSSRHTLRRPEFRPRLSRFYALDKDQD